MIITIFYDTLVSNFHLLALKTIQEKHFVFLLPVTLIEFLNRSKQTTLYEILSVITQHSLYFAQISSQIMLTIYIQCQTRKRKFQGLCFFFHLFSFFSRVLITVTNNMRDNVTADKCDNDNNAINNDNNSYFIPIKFL